eukprot:TRINITY_DN10386_c0_g2_i1.p1 TRINITY_DN10386_c0_g2~~TRINITY_DN10386_c0_g2_i1.p1  ORF type:complete len:363 (+),score=84.04 TRINITY_DN10386_c0_g2_i1:1173-2261(+)
MWNLFQGDVGLCARFYRFLAKNIADNIQQVRTSDVQFDQTPDLTELEEDVTTNHAALGSQTHQDLNKIFHLDPTEELLSVSTCLVIKLSYKIKANLYLFQKNLCLKGSSVDYVQVIPWSKIVQLTFGEDKMTISSQKVNLKIRRITNKQTIDLAKSLRDAVVDRCLSFTLPRGTHVKQVLDRNELEQDAVSFDESRGMAPEDWEFLRKELEISPTLFYKGQAIIKEKEKYVVQILYVLSGSAEVTTEDQSEIKYHIGICTKGQIVGAMSYLLIPPPSDDSNAEKWIPNHTIRVTSKVMEILVIPALNLNLFLAKYVNISGKFFCSLASMLWLILDQQRTSKIISDELRSLRVPKTRRKKIIK